MTNKISRGIKRFFSAMMVAVLATCAPAASATAMAEDTAAAETSYSTQMRGLTAFQIVNDMGAGWNLGNALESENYETYWGNPATTKDMIDDIAQRGFKTLRVPVRWDDHYTNASAYTIDSSYMDRVEEVVNYGLDNDMYVILNVHHNDLQHNVPNTDVISAELTAIWGQIGKRFKDYGDKLIFEVNNEPRCQEDWTGTAAYYESVNLCNEAARAAIRATGGNNADRLVMLPTYCASGDYAKAAAWTKNADDDMIAVSIHAYLPFDFAFEGKGHTDWRDSDLTELASFFGRMESLFLSKGVPVVIGEFGACNKNNTSDREKYAAVYGELARQFAQQDIPCVWWDNNCFSTGSENFGIYDRSQRSFTYGGIADALIGAYDGNPALEEYTTGEDLLSSGGSCNTWGQAVQLDAGTIVTLSAEDTIYCNYTSAAAPEFILQSDSNSAKGWVKIDPDSCADGVAQWKYSTLLSKFGGDLSDLSRGFIGATNSFLTVTKVYIPRTSAHTHSYTGTENITIPATASTKGRKTIGCSVSGCTAYKIEVFEKDGEVKPTNVKATPGDGKVTLTWDAVTGATQYRVCRNVGNGWVNYKDVTTTSLVDTFVTNGTKYYYVVYAYVGGTWSDASSIVSATPPFAASVAGHSLLLGDSIGVKFYMELSDNLVSDESAEMTFTVNGKESVIPVSEAQETTLNEKKVYAFTCYVAAAEMTDVISAQVSMGETRGEVFTYSVQDYAKIILADTEGENAKHIPLVKAMLNYGAAAQEYFDHNTETLANSVLDEGDTETAAVTLSELETYKCTCSDNDADLDFNGYLISLNSCITAKLYFSDTFTLKDVTVLSGGQEVASSRLTIGTDSNGTYLAISEINVGDFDRGFNITVGGITIENFSVYSYLLQCLKNNLTELTDLVNTLYAYNEAVEEIA